MTANARFRFDICDGARHPPGAWKCFLLGKKITVELAAAWEETRCAKIILILSAQKKKDKNKKAYRVTYTTAAAVSFCCQTLNKAKNSNISNSWGQEITARI